MRYQLELLRCLGLEPADDDRRDIQVGDRLAEDDMSFMFEIFRGKGTHLSIDKAQVPRGHIILPSNRVRKINMSMYGPTGMVWVCWQQRRSHMDTSLGTRGCICEEQKIVGG